MNATTRAEINRKNAQNSTGPTSESGKQTSALNGIKHGLTGQRLLLLPHEVEPYQRMTDAFRSDYKPQTELVSTRPAHRRLKYAPASDRGNREQHVRGGHHR